MKPKINDTVRLTELMSIEELSIGAIGVVVAVFSEPEEAYEVEFTNERGETVAQVALRPGQFALVE